MKKKYDVVNTTSSLIIDYKVSNESIEDLKKECDLSNFDLDDKKSFDKADTARKKVKALRGEVEKQRKNYKTPILELGRMVDSTAKEITIIYEDIERPLSDAIKAKVVEIEEKEKIEAEKEEKRVTDLKERLAVFTYVPLAYYSTLTDAKNRLLTIKSLSTDMQEFSEDAKIEKDKAVSFLSSLVAQKEKEIKEREIFEAERIKISKEKESLRIEKQKIEAEKRAVALEKEKIENEKLAKIEADRLEKEKIENEKLAKIEADRLEKADKKRAVALKDFESEIENDLKKIEKIIIGLNDFEKANDYDFKSELSEAITKIITNSAGGK